MVDVLWNIEAIHSVAPLREPMLLLWGVPLGDNPSGQDLRNELERICAETGEDPRSFPSPMSSSIWANTAWYFIEVKHWSRNDIKPADYPGWTKYLSSPPLPWDGEAVRESGFYELARNWRLLNVLACGRKATLVNLGPDRLFEGRAGFELDRFIAALKGDGRRRFIKASWHRFLGDALVDTPDWFTKFYHDRRLPLTGNVP
jgi:hypothetical protein